MIKLDVTYSDYVNTTDPKYPAGKAVDASGEENTDGTPLLAKWMNDINGTRQAIIKEAFGDMSGVSGVPDDVENSDVLKALKKITQEYTNGKVANEAQARTQGDADTLNSAKSYVDQKFIEHYQKGHIQMPGMPSPLEDVTMHYAGYSWYEVNYRGNFFRAKGDNANPFSSKKLTKEQIKNGIYIFQDDEQPDSLKKHKHNVKVYNDGAPDGWEDHAIYDGGMYWNSRYNSGGNSDNMTTWETGDQENRPRDLTFIYWILVKNE